MAKTKESISIDTFIKSGRKGGNTTKKKGSKYFSKIAKLRWANKNAKHRTSCGRDSIKLK